MNKMKENSKRNKQYKRSLSVTVEILKKNLFLNEHVHVNNLGSSYFLSDSMIKQLNNKWNCLKKDIT